MSFVTWMLIVAGGILAFLGASQLAAIGETELSAFEALSIGADGLLVIAIAAYGGELTR